MPPRLADCALGLIAFFFVKLKPLAAKSAPTGEHAEEEGQERHSGTGRGGRERRPALESVGRQIREGAAGGGGPAGRCVLSVPCCVRRIRVVTSRLV